jgi:hypothetical protein
VSDTAQAWVWQHSRTKGTARLVLLALAREAAADGTARVGIATLARLTNAGKGSVADALTRAVALGELEIREPGAGKRAALYALPAAAGYTPASVQETGTEDARSVQETRTLATPLRPGNQDASPSCPGNLDATPPPSVQETGPLQLDLTLPDDRATRARASSKEVKSMREGRSARERTPVIPDFARPLTDAVHAAGHTAIRWGLTPREWLTVQDLIKRSGASALAAFAIDQAGRRRIAHARYFLPGWRELAPASPAGSNVIPLPATGRTHGHQPFQCPPADAYAHDQGF